MKLIYVPIDFSADSVNALEHGVKLANAMKANLRMIHVINTKTFETPFYFKDLDNFHGKSANDFLNLLLYRYQPILKGQLDYKIANGNVSREIVRYAEEDKAVFIVMGTHGTSGAESYWMGSNAFKVVSNAPCPTVTIRNGFIRNAINKLVVPIDASKDTRRKLVYAAEIAMFFDAEVHIIGVTETAMADITKKVESWVHQACEYMSQRKIKTVSDLLKGSNVTDMTIDYAKKIDAELIVIMTEHGEHPVSLIMGAYAQHMVNNSPIPVLTIRPQIVPQ